MNGDPHPAAPAAPDPAAAPSILFGAALILVAVSFLGLALGIRREGLAGDADPGPRALPVAVAFGLLIGGAIETGAGLRRRWPKRRAAAGSRVVGNAATSADDTAADVSDDAADDTAAEFDTESPAGTWNAVVLVAALFAYLVALPWIGFVVATLLFAGGMLMRLGARWWSAALMALLLVAVVQGLFAALFQVQLPRGIGF